MAEKFRALSKIMPKSDKIDTLRESDFRDERHRNMNILLRAQNCWDNMSSFRRERDRCKRFTFGDQLSDKVKLPDGRVMTEEDWIIEQGSVPLKNNLIGRLVQSVVGVYRSQVKEPICVARDRDEQKIGETMSITLQYNNQLNRVMEIQSLLLKEMCIGGVPIAKEIYGWKENKIDCWTEVVPPNDFFVDSSGKDIRGWDVTIIGQIHNISFETVCREFASNREEYQKVLSQEYALAKNRQAMMDTMSQFGKSRLSDCDFLLSSDMTLCRVIEVWTKEQRERYRVHDPNNGEIYKIETEDYEEKVVKINAARRQECLRMGMVEKDIPLLKAEWFIDDFWYFRYLTPTGLVLKEGETPYQHKSHPFIYRVFPGLDAEAHSFVSNVIDQQKYTNKLITTSDFMIKASAKGLLYVPLEALEGTGLTQEDVAAVWSSPNGVLCLNGKAVPQQITSQVSNIGIGDMLNLQMKFFEEISGVNGALQGKPGYSGTSGALYAQQTQNATTSLLDLLDTFSAFCIDIAYKKLKNIQQFYDKKRVINIAGKAAKQVIYDPDKVSDVEFDISIIDSTSTPAYRQVANEFLMQLWSAKAISVEQLLSVGQFPFGDELLQALNSQREQIENGQNPPGLSPELINQVQQQTTPEKQRLLQNIV